MVTVCLSDVGALSSGTSLGKAQLAPKAITPGPPPPLLMAPQPQSSLNSSWSDPIPSSILESAGWRTPTGLRLVRPPFYGGPEKAKLAQGHMERASRDLNSEPLTHRAFDGLPEPSLVSPQIGSARGGWGTCLDFPAFLLPSTQLGLCTWQVLNQYRFHQEIFVPQDNLRAERSPLALFRVRVGGGFRGLTMRPWASHLPPGAWDSSWQTLIIVFNQNT